MYTLEISWDSLYNFYLSIFIDDEGKTYLKLLPTITRVFILDFIPFNFVIIYIGKHYN